MNTPTIIQAARPAIRTSLVRWYLKRGMPDRLAEAVLVCAYLETLLADIPATQTGRLKPVFDYDIGILRADWHGIHFHDLWLDTVTGEVTDSLPPGDGEPLPITIEHLPEAAQRQILFARFAPLFA